MGTRSLDVTKRRLDRGKRRLPIPFLALFAIHFNELELPE